MAVVKRSAFEVAEIKMAASESRRSECGASKVAMNETCVVEVAVAKFRVLEVDLIEATPNKVPLLKGLFFVGCPFEKNPCFCGLSAHRGREILTWWLFGLSHVGLIPSFSQSLANGNG